jgi:3',5'-cyclic-AMP phosphodiesterase
MNILQITDMHLSIPNDNPFGVDCKISFEKALSEGLSRYNVDFIVLSGDLSLQDPDPNVYQYVKDTMQKIDKPNYIISGNHDNPALINEFIFSKVNDKKLYYAEEVEGNKILFLDTTTGEIEAEHWAWLEDVLNQSEEDELTIFMHHPPSLALMPHMDTNYRFLEIDRFIDLLNKYPSKKFYIFCGHYHNERTIVEGNITIFITPSTYAQLSDAGDQIGVYHTKPAYRFIQLKDKKLTTFVNYCDM